MFPHNSAFFSSWRSFFSSSLLLSGLTRGKFYPKRSSGQAAVTGVVPSPPRYVPLFLSRFDRVQPSQCSSISSNVANSRFPLININAGKSPYEYALAETQSTSMHSARLDPTKLIFVGTRTTYQATGDADGLLFRFDVVSYRTGAAVVASGSQW